MNRAARILRVAEVPALIVVPCALAALAVLRMESAALLSILVALLAVLVFFAGFETSKPQLRQIMPTVVLAALASAGRIICAPIPSFNPVSCICIVGGVVFGKRCGFMVGALTALVSNIFLGQAAWTPWQMYAWGLIGYVAGVLADHGAFTHRWVLCAYAFVSPLVYGLILNTWYAIGFVAPGEPLALLAAYAVALPMDLAHAASTVAFLAVLYVPWQRKLERIRVKYDLVAR